MFYTIYKITNTINNKYYIGMHKTKNLDDGYMGSGKLLKRAIKKHGIDNFTKEILFVFDNELDMITKEKELVVVSENTYNLCEGGKGGFGYINRNGLDTGKRNPKSIEQKNKLRISMLGRKLTKKHINKIVNGLNLYYKNNNNSFKDKKHTEETKKKISLKLKLIRQGSNNPQHGTMWITNGIDNKKIKKDLDTIPDGWYKGRKI